MTPEEVPPPSDSGNNPSRPRRRSRRGGRGRRRRPAPGAAASAEATPPESVVDAPSAEEVVSPVASSQDEFAEQPAELVSDIAESETVEPVEEDSVRRESYEESAPAGEDAPISEEPPPPQKRADFRPASPAAVTEAIDEVNRVISSLREVLDTMEEILETLELAEIQKTADEREIQSLREALRQLDRAGGGEPRRSRHDDRRHGRR